MQYNSDIIKSFNNYNIYEGFDSKLTPTRHFFVEGRLTDLLILVFRKHLFYFT